MKNVIITLMAVGLFVLVGCGAPQPEHKEMADSVEDMVGIWHRVGGASDAYGDYAQYLEDGTWLGCAETPDMLGELACQGQFWFEGTQYFQKEDLASGCVAEAGVYEVHLQPNGNHKFVMVEDKCTGRAYVLQGRISFGEDNVEWELVP